MRGKPLAVAVFSGSENTVRLRTVRPVPWDADPKLRWHVVVARQKIESKGKQTLALPEGKSIIDRAKRIYADRLQFGGMTQ